MAEDLADGEFWLPSQFLTDDDIVSDFILSTSDTSDEEINSALRNINFFVPVTCVKAPARSVSPQSTLFVYEQGSSHGSPSEKAADNESENESAPATTTLELLNEAAGEVAKMKLKSDKCGGTGFFDCSKTSHIAAKLPFCPSLPAVKPPQKRVQPPYYRHPLFPQLPGAMMRAPQHKATKNNIRAPKTGANANNRPLGLPQSAWPPLPGQSQTQEQPEPEPVRSIFVGPPRESVGTGVFFPRQIVSQSKPEENQKKSKKNKRS